MYHLKNYFENEVAKLLDTILMRYDDICKCEKCKLDIKALALNSLSTKYTVSEQGELYTSALAEVNKQQTANSKQQTANSKQQTIDVTTAITKAIEIVSANPKH